MAQNKGIPLQELAPVILREIATQIGMPEHLIRNPKRRPSPPITRSSKVEKPLPPGKKPGTMILISTLEDPRITIRNSEWATRGWTYQEGVLSNRRIVFTENQIYWECNGMVMNESLDILDLYDPSHIRFADYMLSGIFGGDLHRVPELQYGFKASDDSEVSEQVLKLDSHIRAFTSRNLTDGSDSLNAFLGVAARYSTNSGLCLLLGMPVWTGLFATEKPGLQDTFALSISAWTHTAQRVAENAEITTTAAGEDENDESDWENAVYVEFFKPMTSNSWARGIARRLWSAGMMLHSIDGSEATRLVGHELVADKFTDQSKRWLLTIREPLVLQHMIFRCSTVEGEAKRLMGKRVQLHLSVPITEMELTIGHRSGELVTVLVFASTVPFVFNGTARYLILRKADSAGTCWERIGRLAMALEEREVDGYKSTAGMVAAMPVKKLGRDIVLI